MAGAPPTFGELTVVLLVLCAVAVAIAWPWLCEWIDRKAAEGEPDLDDDQRGGL